MNDLFYVSGKIGKSVVRSDQDGLDEYESLWKEVNIFKSNGIYNEIQNAFLLLLNISGIFKNQENIVKDNRFHPVTLICLTETDTSNESDLLPPQQHFHRHTFLVHAIIIWLNTRVCFFFSIVKYLTALT